MMKHNLDLNCFSNPYKFFHKPFRWLDWFFHGFKWAWQRATRGYSILDLCDLSTFYSRLICNSLRDFAKRTHGYPIRFEDPEDWTKVLEEMAKDFEHTLEDESVWEEDNYELASERARSDWEGRKAALSSGLELLNEYYWEIWD